MRGFGLEVGDRRFGARMSRFLGFGLPRKQKRLVCGVQGSAKGEWAVGNWGWREPVEIEGCCAVLARLVVQTAHVIQLQWHLVEDLVSTVKCLGHGAYRLVIGFYRSAAKEISGTR